jgi:hypothetical protein
VSRIPPPNKAGRELTDAVALQFVQPRGPVQENESMLPLSTSLPATPPDARHASPGAQIKSHRDLRMKETFHLLRLRLRSLLAGDRMGSSAAAILFLQQRHIAVRGPFVTPGHHRLFLINECLITEEELLALHQTARRQPESLAKCLIDLRRSQTPSFATARRSQRIMLKLRLLVQAEMPDGGQCKIDASTVTVNAHGGLLEATLRLTVGQKITLINPQSGKKVGCSVVSVQGSSGNSFAAAFQFEQPSPSFWQLAFPPLDWAAATAVPQAHNA